MVSTTRPPGPEQGRTVEVEGTTVSYRTIAFHAVLVLIAAGLVFYLIAPNYFASKARRALQALTASVVENGGTSLDSSKREAHFVNLGRTVRMKKAQSPQWIRPDYRTGEAIQRPSGRQS